MSLSVSFNTAAARRDVMDAMTTPDFEKAASFMAANARVLDIRRFERYFTGGDATPVRDAVAAYRNPDGGFGHALEPDSRTPGSQPAAVATALRFMNEADCWDEDLVRGACDWLERVAPAEGGAAFVEPTLTDGAWAPWLIPEHGHPASLIATGMITGQLHARRFSHPWLERATEVMWTRIDQMTDVGPYDVRGVLDFLQHVPDRDRARTAFDQVGDLMFRLHLVTLDPPAAGEVHRPLDFAPGPDSLARVLFDKPVIEAHLDHLAQAQLPDGGWMFNWLAWSPAAERDWRGCVTVDALRILRLNGRL